MQFLLDDGDEHVGSDRAPDLGLHGILACTQKALDPQVLFDPFEEELHLQADPKELRALPWPCSQDALPGMLSIFPLIYQGTVYLSVNRYVEQDVRHPHRDVIFTDTRKGPSAPWVVIGKFLPDHTFHDLCYFQAR